MRANRWILVTVLLSMGAWIGQAAADEPTMKAIPVVLHPAPAPRPALKYQLLPTFFERHPGNAAVRWNRMPFGREKFWAEFLECFDGPQGLNHWVDDIPLGDPRDKEYREKEGAKGIKLLRDERVFADMTWAAQLESCNWELPIREGDYAWILLPEIQQMRGFNRWLYCRAHLEIAEGRYDAALATLKDGLALGRQVAQGECLVSSLVGITIASVDIGQVRALIQRPDAPNLYWAVSALPRPLIDLRPGIEAESHFLYLQFPELRNLEQKSLTPDGWRRLLGKVVKFIDDAAIGPGSKKPGFDVEKALQKDAIARQGLVERGWKPSEVEAMPAAQAVLLYTVRLYDELGDERYKWLSLPAAEVVAGQAKPMAAWEDAAKQEIIPVAKCLCGAVGGVKIADLRLQTEVAALRVLEALRLYAAEHDGRWPERLSDITSVPVPVDPYSGKPFLFERHGDRAVLKSAAPFPRFPWYDITFKPAEKDAR